MKKRKYFKKLFIIYFGMTLVFGLILSTYFVVQNSKALEKQQLDYHKDIANQVIKNVDQRLWSLLKYTDTLFVDDAFTDYLMIKKDYYTITKVFSKLNSDMVVFSDLGARIAVTKIRDNLVITNQATRDLSLFYEEIIWDSETIEKVMNFYNDSESTNNFFAIKNPKDHQLHILRKRKVNNAEWLLLILSVDLNRLEKDNEDVAIDFFFDRNSSIEEDDMVRQMIANQLDYKIDQQRLVLIKPSTIHEDFYYEVQMDYLRENGLVKRYGVPILLFIATLVLGYAIAFVTTKSIYKPIGIMMSQFNKSDELIKDEFAFLEKVTYDIMEANEELQQTIGHNKIDLKTKFIREMLNGLMSETQLELGIESYGLHYMKEDCRVILIEIDELEDYKMSYLSEARNSIRRSVYTIIENTLTIEGLYFDLCEMSYNTYALIVGEWTKEGLNVLLGKTLKAIQIGEQVGIFMAVGEQVTDYHELTTSYQSARNIIDYKLSFDKRAIVTAEDMIERDVNQHFYYTLEIEKELFIATVSGRCEKVEIIFSRLFKQNFEDRQLEDREKMSLILSLITTLRRIEQKLPQEKALIDGIALEQVLSKGPIAFVDTYNEVEKVFLSYAETAKIKTESKDDEVLRMMITYVENHYHEDISLEEVANHLNISSGYFSTIFKKLSGSNFKTYLNKYRVLKAKELLNNNPDIKIKDLTLRIGYNNVNSFIRMFKKYEGISPGEYAKMDNSKI